jgi:hypothetical protein
MKRSLVCDSCLHPGPIILTGKDEPSSISALVGCNPLFPFHIDVVSDWSPLHDAAIHGRLLTLRSLINQVAL